MAPPYAACSTMPFRNKVCLGISVPTTIRYFSTIDAVSSHLFPEFSSHLLAVTPTAHWLEFTDWAGPLLENPLTVTDGHVHIPDAPGAGIEWNEDAVEKYAVPI